MREKNSIEVEDAELEDLIRRFDAGEQAWKETDEIIEVEFKQPLDKVVPVRLTADAWAALYREARELGVGPTTLARMWILEKLRTLRPAQPAAATTQPGPRRRATGAAAAPSSSAKKRKSA